jgi:chromosomal replication initiation ATPase DnaA
MTVHEYTHELIDTIMKTANIEPILKHKIVRKIHNLRSYRDFCNRKLVDKQIQKSHRPVSKIVFHMVPAHIQQVMKLSCEKNEVDLVEFCSNRRKDEIVEAQRYVIYFLHKEMKVSCNMVGRWFMKDHSTILHACTAHENAYDTRKMYSMVYDSFRQEALEIIARALPLSKP